MNNGDKGALKAVNLFIQEEDISAALFPLDQVEDFIEQPILSLEAHGI